MRKVINIATGYTVMLIYTFIFYKFNKAAMAAVWGEFTYSCIIAPLWESLVFIWAPLALVKDKKHLWLPVVIISSFIFGMGHKFSPNPILIQGVFGVIFSMVYIKNGFSYWSAVILHGLWNFTVMYMINFK